MSKVLKFRAWDKEKNRWAREWDRELEDQEDQIYEKEYSEDSHWLDGDVASDLDLVNGRLNLDRYVWEQCTGLADKNGTPIYEGDVVSWTNSAGVSMVYEVYFNELRAAFLMNPIVGDEYIEGMSAKKTPYIEVIGNIHQKKWTPDDA